MSKLKNNKNIIIVDDDQIWLNQLSRALTRRGYTTFEANSVAFCSVWLRIVSIVNPLALRVTAKWVATFPEPMNDMVFISFKLDYLRNKSKRSVCNIYPLLNSF